MPPVQANARLRVEHRTAGRQFDSDGDEHHEREQKHHRHCGDHDIHSPAQRLRALAGRNFGSTSVNELQIRKRHRHNLTNQLDWRGCLSDYSRPTLTLLFSLDLYAYFNRLRDRCLHNVGFSGGHKPSTNSHGSLRTSQRLEGAL